MTNEQIAKLGAMRMKHPLTRGALCWIFTEEELAALISEVSRNVERRVARECAELCDDIHDEYEGEDILATWCAEGIRAKFLTGKEGK